MIFELLKEKVKLKDNLPNQFYKIFEFIELNEINENTYDFDIDKMFKTSIFNSFSEKEALSFIETVKKIDFSDEEFYEKEEESINIYYFKTVMSNAKCRLIDLLDEKYKLGIYNDSEHFELDMPASQPDSAYKRVGNNKLDITPTGRDYGLLFR